MIDKCRTWRISQYLFDSHRWRVTGCMLFILNALYNSSVDLYQAADSIIVFYLPGFYCCFTPSLFRRPWPHCEVIQWLSNFSKWCREVIEKGCRRWDDAEEAKQKLVGMDQKDNQVPGLFSLERLLCADRKLFFPFCASSNWKRKFSLPAELSSVLSEENSELGRWTSTRRLWITCSHITYQVRKANILSFQH